MIANVSAHRRAHAFAQALEDQELRDAAARGSEAAALPADTEARHEGRGGGTAGGDRGRPDGPALLTVARELRALPTPQLAPEVKATQRAQLIAAMEESLSQSGRRIPEQRGGKRASNSGKGAHRASPLSKLRPRSRWSKGLAAGGLTVGVAAGALGGVAAASSDALPGDSLYGLKRGMEDIKRKLADDDAERGRIYLHQASTRMNEARRLLERGRGGDLDDESVRDVRKALSGMRHDAAEGQRLLTAAYDRDGSVDALRALSSFSSAQRDNWSALQDRLPRQLGDLSDQVTSVFDAMEAHTAPLRSIPDQSGQADSRSSTPPRPDETDQRQASQPPPSTSSEPTPGGGTPRPTPTGHGHGDAPGLLGDNGILSPPSHGGDTPSGDSSRPTDGKEHGGESPEPKISIPPLLPDLLPGLRLDGEDDTPEK